jgi:hypothetical protein
MSRMLPLFLGTSRLVAYVGIAGIGHGSRKGRGDHHRPRANALLIVDDGLARRHAKVVGVALTGTLGVLVKAKMAGHIPTVATLISRLTELGFRLSDRTRDEIPKLANEG